ncbi:adenylosuccinate synthase, partial [Oleiphilus sp. HI0073]
AREIAKGANKIGTTGRGIGPAYEDKVSRRGLRLGDLANPASFAEKLKEIMTYHNFVLENFYKVEPISYEKTLEETLKMGEELLPLAVDVTDELHAYRERGDNIMFEGAQGSLLDIDHGTYPFVTSSNTTAGGTATGSGFGPMYLDYVLGITKAYTTRVGSGPFPTELFDDNGRHLAEKGHEFGATTGRPRRCGWFDAVGLRHAIQINSVSGICLTKLDVLDGLDTIKVCVAYKTKAGENISRPPLDGEGYDDLEPIYEELPGWSESTLGAKTLDELPENARAYIKYLEQKVQAPIDIISTGPDRIETIVLRHPFDA